MKKLFILFLLLPFLLSACAESGGAVKGTTEAVTTELPEALMLVPVDWANFIKLDGVTYFGDWEETEVSPDEIGEKIGEVTCGVPNVYSDAHGNIFNSEPDDGAAFGCPIGTEVFSINGKEDSVAACVSGKYYLYKTR